MKNIAFRDWTEQFTKKSYTLEYKNIFYQFLGSEYNIVNNNQVFKINKI